MKLAVIGAGYWGKNLVRNFFELGVLRAVCDSDPEKIKAVKKIYSRIKTTLSYKNILSDRKIEAVVIATPARTHYKLAKMALRKGKDVFVEKPLALTAIEGMELVKLAKSTKKLLMVGHLLEYHPGIIKLKELIDAGELGKIYYIYSNRLNLGKIRREENILWSFAPHDISVMLLLLNEMPVSIFARGGNYLHKDIADVTISNLGFKSGVKGHIFVSWLHPYKEQKLIVVGDKRMALFDDVAKKGKLRVYNRKIELRGKLPVEINGDAKIINFSRAEPLREECEHFLRCLKTREKPKTDGYSGVRVLKVLEACQRSLRKN
ncbi:MAG: Gfo/Idh/MocA family oxidoreductase [Omnitrophica bacterium]|nr:Gfo/Idh/MocA family oxidoreductase [Candidatus Omnitrophota bacterium]